MKILNKFLLLAMLSVVFARDSNDDEELLGQDYKPTLTITASVANGNVNEGTSVTYSISYDKPINHPIALMTTLVSGVAGADDVELGITTIPANATSGSITVNFVDDLVPEINESAVIKIEGANEDSNYYINPATQLVNYSYSIVSAVNPTDLVVAFEWDYDTVSDNDLFLFDASDASRTYAATGDTPEIGNLILGTDPDGSYFLAIDPYSLVAGDETGIDTFDYNFIFGKPDGSVSNLSGTFDFENRDSVYDVSGFIIGSSVTFAYKVAKIEKSGSVFTVTAL